MQDSIILGVGELLWDVLPDGKVLGGAPANFAFHAQQVGARAYVFSAVGKDNLGDDLITHLTGHNVDHVVPQVDFPTGTVDVMVEEGIPQYTIHEQVAWDHIPLKSEMLALAREASAISFGTLAMRSPCSKNTILELIKATPKQAMRLFDVNLRQSYYSKALLEEIFPLVNALKINDDELVLLTEMFDLPEGVDHACQSLIDRYQLELLILTAGAHYSIVYYKSERSKRLHPRITVVDTIGAGDCFAGSLMACLTKGDNLLEAHTYAVHAAAKVCQYAGAWVKH